MAFADYVDLQTAVVEHVRNPSIADVFPRLVKLAEADFHYGLRKLRTRDMIVSEPMTVFNGSAPLPYDFLEVIGVYDGAGREYIAQPVQPMQPINSRGYYAIVGSDLVASQDENLTLQYYAQIPTLSTGGTASNWLLQKHPALYLYAVGLQAAIYLRDAETAQATIPLLDAAYQAVMGQEAGERYSRARVRVQGVTP